MIFAVTGDSRKEVMQPFRTRRDVSKRRMVTADVADDVLTVHITTFAPGGGRDASQTTSVHYNVATLAVVADRRVEPLREPTPVLTYWGSE